jgi:WD40 repeat protein
MAVTSWEQILTGQITCAIWMVPNTARLGITYSTSAFSPDDKWVAFADYSTDTVFVWDIDMSKWLFSGRLGIPAKNFTGARGIEQLLFIP